MHEAILDALRRGAAAEAVAASRDAVAAQPQDPTAHRLLAAALRLDGDREAALAAIDQAVALAPDDANLHLERAGLLLQERQLDEAQAALARTTGLDPNQFPAYVMQAHIALGRGDFDEAERLARTAARIAPDHPHVAAVDGNLALRRGDADRALALLSAAAQRHPDEPQLRHALGFAYMAKGHFAFAEQAFRSLLERDPDSVPLRTLVADLLRRQDRYSDAAQMLSPLLDRPDATTAMRRVVGELELAAGRNERALELLRTAVTEQPGDRRNVVAVVEAWRRLGAADDARATLDALLAEHPASDDLWNARLLFEEFAGDAARAIVARWQEAMPDFIPALGAMLTIHDRHGEHDQAEALARRITELQPGHTQAELRVVDAMMHRDPEEAVTYVESLLARATDESVKRSLRQLLGRTLDVAGQPDAAAATWVELQAEAAPQRLPLPTSAEAKGEWPPLAPLPDPAPGVLLLWGPPGSLVERIAFTFEAAGGPLRADRLGAQPPRDPLQRYGTTQALVDGSLDGSYLVNQWRAALPGRGINDGQVFDWLLWWDNALLLALRPHLPEAVLMVVLRDPREMLLDWLAWGGPVPFALESPLAGAQWMANVLAQIADLHEQDLFPHRLVKLDEIAEDPIAIAQAISDALDIQINATPPGMFGPQHFPRDHWRAFAEPLAEAFAVLTPVAVRLGYPEA